VIVVGVAREESAERVVVPASEVMPQVAGSPPEAESFHRWRLRAVVRAAAHVRWISQRLTAETAVPLRLTAELLLRDRRNAAAGRGSWVGCAMFDGRPTAGSGPRIAGPTAAKRRRVDVSHGFAVLAPAGVGRPKP